MIYAAEKACIRPAIYVRVERVAKDRGSDYFIPFERALVLWYDEETADFTWYRPHKCFITWTNLTEKGDHIT